MAYIQPDSVIEFFGPVNLSPDHADSLYFASTAEKDAYFNNPNLKITSVSRCYYARESRGYVQVEVPMYQLIGCRYMRFKNTSFENKWFYAFVTEVSYVNNITSRVSFQLDVLLTWMGDFALKSCFVERQHAAADYIGANTVPENLATGTPVVRSRTQAGATGGFSIVIFMSHQSTAWLNPGPTLELFQPTYTGGVLNGLDMIWCGDKAAFDFVLDTINRNVWNDNVLAIKMLPSNYKPATGSTVILNQTLSYSANKPYSDIAGYVPKNNKLFVYPYNYVTLDNSEGQQNTYKYEFFGQVPPNQNNYTTYRFDLIGAWSVDMQLIAVPANYAGAVNTVPENYEERLAMQDFPSCAWNVDAFKAMMAQKESNLPTRLLASAMNGAAQGLVTKSMGSDIGSFYTQGAINTGIAGITDILANRLLPPNMPTYVKGSQGSSVLIGQQNKDFIVTEWNISAEDAKIIDDYFTMYGYSDHTVHEPSMYTRTRFTYVKTRGCKVSCRCPASDAQEIEAIFNRGCRFWRDAADIGNYSAPNPPIS